MTDRTSRIAKRACDLMEQDHALSLRAAVAVAEQEEAARELLGPPARRWGDEADYLHNAEQPRA